MKLDIRKLEKYIYPPLWSSIAFNSYHEHLNWHDHTTHTGPAVKAPRAHIINWSSSPLLLTPPPFSGSCYVFPPASYCHIWNIKIIWPSAAEGVKWGRRRLLLPPTLGTFHSWAERDSQRAKNTVTTIVLSRKSYYPTVISESVPCKHQFTIIHSSRIV